MADTCVGKSRSRNGGRLGQAQKEPFWRLQATCRALNFKGGEYAKKVSSWQRRGLSFNFFAVVGVSGPLWPAEGLQRRGGN